MNPAIREAIEAADAVSEHLLIHHANCDAGTLITDEGINTGHPVVQHVLRHSFNSSCVAPNECWNKLEAAIRTLARIILTEASAKLLSLAVSRGHTGSVTVALFAEWCKDNLPVEPHP